MPLRAEEAFASSPHVQYVPNCIRHRRADGHRIESAELDAAESGLGCAAADQVRDQPGSAQRLHMIGAGHSDQLAAGNAVGDCACAVINHRVFQVTEHYHGRDAKFRQPGEVGGSGCSESPCRRNARAAARI